MLEKNRWKYRSGGYRAQQVEDNGSEAAFLSINLVSDVPAAMNSFSLSFEFTYCLESFSKTDLN